MESGFLDAMAPKIITIEGPLDWVLINEKQARTRVNTHCLNIPKLQISKGVTALEKVRTMIRLRWLAPTGFIWGLISALQSSKKYSCSSRENTWKFSSLKNSFPKTPSNRSKPYLWEISGWKWYLSKLKWEERESILISSTSISTEGKSLPWSAKNTDNRINSTGISATKAITIHLSNRRLSVSGSNPPIEDSPKQAQDKTFRMLVNARLRICLPM